MQILAIPGIPEIEPGADLAELLLQALAAAKLSFMPGDILCLAQKIVSKAEDQYRYLDQVTTSARANDLAQQCDKDPRLVELILSESEEVLRLRPGVIIVQHKRGYVHANAGIDRSNLAPDARERVLLLPQDSDRSAANLRMALEAATGVALGVLINDSAGRAWRVGTAGMAIGVAGFEAVQDLIGKPDRDGRIMEVSQVAVADELAAAASFVMGQGAEGIPAVILRDTQLAIGEHTGSAVLIRDKQMDMFR